MTELERAALQALTELELVGSSDEPHHDDKIAAIIAALRQALVSNTQTDVANHEIFRLGYAKGMDDEKRRAKFRSNRSTLTDAQLASACLSYRHDFGLLSKQEQETMVFQAREWEQALEKEHTYHDISLVDSNAPLYFSESLPSRQPLTDEQIVDLYFDGFSISKLKEFARAIERAHGISGAQHGE